MNREPAAVPAAQTTAGHRRKPMSGSIVWKLFGSVVLCLFVLLLFNLLLNNYVLVSYYQNIKQKSLEQTFQELDGLYAGQAEKVDDYLMQQYYDKNISTGVLSGTGRLELYGWVSNQRLITSLLTGSMAQGDYLVKIIEDTESGSRFITLSGRLTNGRLVVMRTPVAAIEESVAITNQFLMISGVVPLVISLGLSLLIARSFTRPIRELSRVAGSMARLNFNDRYTGKGRGELADLGNSINSMADSLEGTISSLKTANVQLAGDVERKTRQEESRKAFISNVSHELKTPISLIQTYAEGLRENIADEESRSYYCEVIEDEAQKMSELLKKMTALMQLEAGGDQLVIKRFDVAGLIRSLILKNRPRFEQAEARVVPPPDQPVYVWADAYLMENVLQNYLSNAINHVDKGGRIEVAIHPSAEGRVRITVYNTGAHIPPDDLARVWESFYKVDKARTREYGGTGIGLSVVAAIMKAHQMPYGVYNRQSAAETGVEFFIELEAR